MLALFRKCTKCFNSFSSAGAKMAASMNEIKVKRKGRVGGIFTGLVLLGKALFAAVKFGIKVFAKTAISKAVKVGWVAKKLLVKGGLKAAAMAKKVGMKLSGTKVGKKIIAATSKMYKKALRAFKQMNTRSVQRIQERAARNHAVLNGYADNAKYAIMNNPRYPAAKAAKTVSKFKLNTRVAQAFTRRHVALREADRLGFYVKKGANWNTQAGGPPIV